MKNYSEKIPWILLLALSICGVVMVAYLTRGGPGVSGDAVHYMQGAQNLLDGKGYARLKADGSPVPITGFPPFFSLALAIVRPFVGSALDAGRWLNALLTGVNIFLAGLILRRLTRSWWAALLGALFVLFARDVLLWHAWVMSEALFVTLSLLGLLVLAYYWEKRQRGWLLLAAFIIGLAVITRYVGVALALAAGLGMLLLSEEKWKRRLADFLILGVVSAAPLGLWLLRNARLAGNLTARKSAFHGLERDLLVAFFDEISSWFVPNELHFAWRTRLLTFGLIVLIAGGLFAWSLFRRRFRGRELADERLWVETIMVAYLFGYVVILVVNSLSLDASTSTAGMRRYLVPVYAVLVIWLVSVFYGTLVAPRGDTEHRTRSLPAWLGIGVGALAIGLLAIYANQTLQFLRDPGFVFGYTDVKNASADAVQALQAVPAERTLLANDYEFVYYLAGRPPLSLPKSADQFTAQENVDFEADLQTVEKLLQAGALLVVVDEDENPADALQTLSAHLVPAQSFHRITFYVWGEK